MAKKIQNRAASVTKINPAQPAPQSEESAEQKSTGKRNRRPYYPDAEGKPARGLEKTPEGYTLETRKRYKLAQGQFRNASCWFAHLAYMASLECEHYEGLAKDAHEHPENYRRGTSGVTKNALQKEVSALEKALLAAFIATGLTEEQAQAKLAETVGA